MAETPPTPTSAAARMAQQAQIGARPSPQPPEAAALPWPPAGSFAHAAIPVAALAHHHSVAPPIAPGSCPDGPLRPPAPSATPRPSTATTRRPQQPRPSPYAAAPVVRRRARHRRRARVSSLSPGTREGRNRPAATFPGERAALAAPLRRGRGRGKRGWEPRGGG
nr:classical arabinogalactan protein 9-like [Lolium perenne]